MYDTLNYFGIAQAEMSHMTTEQISEYVKQRDKKIKAVADSTFAECQKQGLKIVDLECVIKELQDKIHLLEDNFRCSNL